MTKRFQKQNFLFLSLLLPIFLVLFIIGMHSKELINSNIHLLLFLFLFITIVLICTYFIKNRKLQNNEKLSKKKKIVLLVLLSLEIMGGTTFLTLLYGPWDHFRNWLIPSAMTTMHHKYLATWFYSKEEIESVLEANQIIEPKEETNTEQIEPESPPPIVYENEYEEKIFKDKKEGEVYRIIPIEEKKFTGYLAVIYDATRVSVATTRFLDVRGEYTTEMASVNNALLAVNGGGFIDPNLNGAGGSPQGITIKNKKVITNYNYSITGGLIGFNEENKLILGRMTLEEAKKKNIRDAVSFGPFLIVNGKKAFIKGNGGWGFAPRTAIGQRKDGIVLLLVVDGRTLKYPGASMVDLTTILDNYGAINAANLDGGTSSTIVLPEEEAKKYIKESELKSHCRKNYCYINDPIDSTGAHKTRPVASTIIVK